MKKRLNVVIAAVVLLMATLVLFACKKDKIENTPSVGGEPQSSWTAKCDFRSDAYDVDDVKLTYGIRGYNRTDTDDVTLSTAQIVVVPYRVYNIHSSDSINGGITVKTIENVKLVYADYALCYDVEITVPKESFVLNYGAIAIDYNGKTTETVTEKVVDEEHRLTEVERDVTEKIGGVVRLYYKVDGNKVYLSETLFESTAKPQFTEFVNGPLAIGYESQTNRKEAVDFCAINADKSVFAVNDVNVKLSVGRLFDEAKEENSSVYLALFTDSLIFGDSGMTENINATEESECISYEIKNYNAENYSCQRVTDAGGDTEAIEYSHKESLVLPQELFAGNYKKLSIKLYVENPNDNPQAKLLANVEISYYVFDGKVYLSQKSAELR